MAGLTFDFWVPACKADIIVRYCANERQRVPQADSELARKKAIACSWHPDKGKGSHGLLKYGDRRTVVRNPKDELKTGTYHAMLKQLGLKDEDLK